MKILSVENGSKTKGVEVRALMGTHEFAQLVGNIDKLCVFATITVCEPASTIKTGARHNHAKYLLFPVRLRRKFSATEFDFDKVSCGTVMYGETLFVVYGVCRKTVPNSVIP